MNKFKREKGIGKVSNTLFPSLFVIILLIVVYLFFPVKILRASQSNNQKELKFWKIRNGESFSIHYIHSVEKSSVIENFIVEGKDIILQDTYFHSYGAGLPATTPYKFEKTKDGFRIYDINQKIDDLIYRTSSPDKDHKITVKGQDYMLLDFSAYRTGVRFDIVNKPRYRLIFNIFNQGGE